MKKTLSDFKKELLNSIFPVNSVVTFHDNADHSNFLGFTWERFANGRTLIGCGNGVDKNNQIKNFEVGDSDGEYEHTLTVAGMPSHAHTISWTDSDGEVSGGWNVTDPLVRYGTTGVGFMGIKTFEHGGGQPHNNMQPYIVTAFWIRVG